MRWVRDELKKCLSGAVLLAQRDRRVVLDRLDAALGLLRAAQLLSPRLSSKPARGSGALD